MSSSQKIPYSDSFKFVNKLGKNDPSAFLDICQKAPLVQLSFPRNILILNDPLLIKDFLLKDIKVFKKSLHYDEFKFALGEGLITSNGEEWENSRKASGSFFSPLSVQAFSSEIESTIQSEINLWMEKQKGEIDLWDNFLNVTFKIIAQAVFGYNLEHLKNDARGTFDNLSTLSIERMFMPIKLPRFIPIKNHRRMKECVRKLDLMAYELVHNTEFPPKNLLKKILSNPPEIFNAKKVRDEALTLLAAGYETMGAALYWIFYLLLKHPDKLSKMIQSIKSGDDLYLKNVIKESLRLYPTVPLVSRTPIGKGDFNGIKLKKNQIFMIPIFSLHRNPKYWDRPEEFLPERFESEINENAYIPFLKGARKCIGENLAIHTLQSFLQNFFKTVKIKDPESFDRNSKNDPKLYITLKPEINLKIKIERL